MNFGAEQQNLITLWSSDSITYSETVGFRIRIMPEDGDEILIEQSVNPSGNDFDNVTAMITIPNEVEPKQTRAELKIVNIPQLYITQIFDNYFTAAKIKLETYIRNKPSITKLSRTIRITGMEISGQEVRCELSNANFFNQNTIATRFRRDYASSLFRRQA